MQAMPPSNTPSECFFMFFFSPILNVKLIVSERTTSNHHCPHQATSTSPHFPIHHSLVTIRSPSAAMLTNTQSVDQELTKHEHKSKANRALCLRQPVMPFLQDEPRLRNHSCERFQTNATYAIHPVVISDEAVEL